MRIVYVLTSLGVGGAERQVLSLADRMSARGHAVALLVLRPRDPDDCATSHQVVHLNLRKTPTGLMAGLWRGARFLHAFRPDLVHSHNFHGNMLARLLTVAYQRAPLVATIHNVYEGGWLRMLAYRITDRRTALTTAVGHAAAERYIGLKAVSRSRCVVLTNGIDTVKFAADFARRLRMRSELEVMDEFVWLAAGRVVPAKDFPNLLHAFACVRKAQPHAKLFIAGSHAAGGRFAAFAVHHGSMKGVRWLGPRRDMPDIFDAADAFVLSSAWEGMPLVLGEAMAMKKPFVATDVGGVRELAGNCGSIVPSADSTALAEAMLSVMRLSAETRLVMGRAARERIVTSFNLDARADAWESLYASVIRKEPIASTPWFEALGLQ